LGAFAASIVPVLLTTRVDAHRLVTVVAPIVIWTGIGLASALAMARALGTPKLLLHGCGIALLVLSAAEGARLLHHPVDPMHPSAARVLAATAGAKGPVVVISRLDFRDLGAVVLEAAERRRRDPARAPRVLHRDRALALSDDGAPGEDQLSVLVSFVEQGAAMLVPDLAYDELAGRARDGGLEVEHRTAADLGYWWITSGD
jgi:hypothetical protein